MTDFEQPGRKLVKIHRQLVEVNVGREWVCGQILLLMLAVIFGISGGVVLSLLNNDDYDSKVLCGAPMIASYVDKPITKKPTYQVNKTCYLELKILTLGKNDDACAFTQYTLISSFVFGTIWIGFFLMCRQGKSSQSADVLPKPWRIVLPALVFTSIFSIVALAASIQLTIQTNGFCQKFDVEFAGKLGKPRLPGSCQDLNRFLPANTSSYTLAIQPMIMLGEATAWLTTIFWMCSAGLCLLRMFMGPDFRTILMEDPVEEPTQVSKGALLSGYRTLEVSSPGSQTKSGRCIKSIAQVHGEAEKATHNVSRPRVDSSHEEEPNRKVSSSS